MEEMEEVPSDERRKYRRFTDRSLAGVQIKITPCPPLYGEPASGILIDLSAGGMAIIMPDILPRNVFLKLKLVLPTGFLIESVVKVKHVLREGDNGDFLHGFEFLNPSPEMIEGIEKLADDILGCNDRFKAKAEKICLSECSLFSICRRPQRQQVAEAKKTDPVELTVLMPESADTWSAFKTKILRNLKMAA